MDGQTDAGQGNPYVPLCFADDTQIWQYELNVHAKYEVSISYGWKVIAKVNDLPHADQQLDAPKLKFWGIKKLVKRFFLQRCK